MLLFVMFTMSIAGCAKSETTSNDDGKSNDEVKVEVNDTQTSEEVEAMEEVELTLGSWRADDVEQMNNLLAEYKKKLLRM